MQDTFFFLAWLPQPGRADLARFLRLTSVSKSSDHQLSFQAGMTTTVS